MESKEVQKDTNVSKEEKKGEYIPGKPYSKIRRELTDSDLNNPAVQKILLGEIDRLEITVAELETYRKDFHAADKEKAILSEKLLSNTRLEILYSFCLSVGSALMGLSTLFKIDEKGWIFLLVGGLLILGGVFSKFKK